MCYKSLNFSCIPQTVVTHALDKIQIHIILYLLNTYYLHSRHKIVNTVLNNRCTIKLFTLCWGGIWIRSRFLIKGINIYYFILFKDQRLRYFIIFLNLIEMIFLSHSLIKFTILIAIWVMPCTSNDDETKIRIARGMELFYLYIIFSMY